MSESDSIDATQRIQVVSGEIVEDFDGASGGDYSPLPVLWQGVGNFPAKLNDLKQRPKNIRPVVKTRQGRGGNIQYIPWTSVADMFDDVFGPGQWRCKVVRIGDETRQDPNDKGYMVTDVTVWCTFEAPGILPFDVFGWGKWYQKDNNANKSDAIESAISRAITKAGARLSKYARAVWAKDDELIQEFAPPKESQVAGVVMALDMIWKTNEKGLRKLLSDYGAIIPVSVPNNKFADIATDELKKMSGSQVAEIGKKAPTLMLDEDEDG